MSTDHPTILTWADASAGHERASVDAYTLYVFDLGGWFDWQLCRATPDGTGRFITGGKTPIGNDRNAAKAFARQSAEGALEDHLRLIARLAEVSS